MTVGYLYKSTDKLDLFENAATGQTTSNPDYKPWSSAVSVLCAVAWGLGAPEFLEKNEILSLIKGWENRPIIKGTK